MRLEELEKIDDYRWRIPKTGAMRVEGIIFASEKIIGKIVEERAVEQVRNVACLPGIVKASLAMPDAHWGYGFPIGGVAAMDIEEGVVSPGGVGYDINCGVRLVATSLGKQDVAPRARELVARLFQSVPAGVGSHGAVSLSRSGLADVLRGGARWAVGAGYGTAEDAELMEEGGRLPVENPDRVSDRAVERGAGQVGTLGSGNHFLEVQWVERVFDPAIAEVYGLHEGQVVVMIHSGSRGFGHQVCDDFLKEMAREAVKAKIVLPDRQLACAPMGSDAARRYFDAMNAAANFAWANRQVMMHTTREVFARFFGESPAALGMRLVYDVCHNIAKKERHVVDGRERLLVVHRKGATRSFGPGRPEIPARYRAVGQPVLIPGDMGTASWVLAGTDGAMAESFGSACHGAGRMLSRKAASARKSAAQVRSELEKQGIWVLAADHRTLAEEMPEAYKDVDEVVEAVHGAGIGRKVARLRPMAVMKG